MLTLEELSAIEEIKQLKALYFRAFDTKDWEAYRTVFCDDIVADYTGCTIDPSTGRNLAPDATSEVLVGIDAVVAGTSASGEKGITVHHGHTVEIKITGENTAQGIWAMQDLVRYPAGGDVVQWIGYGHYHETYERVNGRWKIKTLRLPRMLINIEYANPRE